MTAGNQPKNIHADELVQDFYKRHPLAIRTTQFPLIIHSTPMSTTSLTDRIEDAPTSLTLAECLSSPSPSACTPSPTATRDLPLVPIHTCPPSQAYTEPSKAEVDVGMIGCDLATPQGFSMFNRTIPNHHKYGQQIKMLDATFHWPHYIQFVVNTTTHNHYVYVTRDDLYWVKYGWVLEATPFICCTSPGVDNTQLQPLLRLEEQHLGVNIALNTINDKGVTADVDQLRELAMEDVVLTH